MKEITRKTLLYKSGVEYADWCINHIEGCAHGCNFPCYAMMMKKGYGIIKDYRDWINPKIVKNSLKLLEKEIPRYKDKIKSVHLCFSTDPFMYKYPEVKTLTLRIIALLNKNNISVTVLTKGIYPEILTNHNLYSKNNYYSITLVSLDKNFKDKFEPYSAPYASRIKALRYLHDNGLKTGISMEPYPTPNIIKQDISNLLESISFVDKIYFGRWNYSSLTSDPKYQTFYNECALIVERFCDTNNISYYAKKGTIS